MGYVSSPTYRLTLLIGQCSRLHKPNEEFVGQQQPPRLEAQALVGLDQQPLRQPVRDFGECVLGLRPEPFEDVGADVNAYPSAMAVCGV